MKLSRTAQIILIIVLNIALDQITKVIVRTNMTYGREGEIDVLGKYFQLIWVENKGAFLGMGSDMAPVLKLIFLLVLPALVLGYVVYYILKTKSLDRISLIAFCCIVGGGVANVFDRIVFGQVTDFMYMEFTDTLKTGIFNFADVSVTTGIILLVFSNFLGKKKKNVEETTVA